MFDTAWLVIFHFGLGALASMLLGNLIGFYDMQLCKVHV